MTNLSIFSFNSNQVRVVSINGEPWFVGRDVLVAAKSSTTVTAMKSMIEEGLGEEFVKLEPIQTTGGCQTLLLLSELAVSFFLSKSRKSEAKNLAEQLKLSYVIAHSKQSRTISIIRNAFIHLNPVEEFFVSGYRIDLYFPLHRIAIECDEDHHSRQKICDQFRQDTITKLLGCSWIRYSPDEQGFCVGKVINRILLAISEITLLDD